MQGAEHACARAVFAQLLSAQATEASEGKTTITAEHVTQALQQLGFGHYLPAVQAYQAELAKQRAPCASCPAGLRRMALQ